MIWAWLGAAAVGLSLGLLGSGGAILTVPILVYIVGHDEKIAITESLAIVGAIAVAGAVRAGMQRQVDWRGAALLSIPGIAGTYTGAHVAAYLSGAVQLVLLAALMLAASALMFTNGRTPLDTTAGEAAAAKSVPLGCGPSKPCAIWVVALQGVGLGFVTGLVGVGGGFLIVPVLVLLRRLPMPTAVGTSLAIIAVNSSIGFLKYFAALNEHASPSGEALRMDWSIIGVFAAVGVVSSLVGNILAGRIDQATLKRLFAAFLVVAAGYIFVRQAPRVLPGVFGESPRAVPATSREK